MSIYYQEKKTLMNKIFQIGFNKCGTSSIYSLFQNHTKYKLPAIHWDYGLLSLSIFDNISNSKRPLSPKYDKYTVFTDMECNIRDSHNNVKFLYAYKLFEILDKHYPNSKFILNTRDIDSWIQSRMNHICQYEIDQSHESVKLPQDKTYYEIYSEFVKIKDKEKIIDLWKKDWYTHHINVLTYFKDRPKDLLLYNFDTDPFEKFVNFFSNVGFTVSEMPVKNKTKVPS